MKKLGRILIETIVEVPTKLVKGEQRYKTLKTWAPIPQEMVEASLLRKLENLVQTTDEGFVEVMAENKAQKYYWMPRYYLVRAVVEQHVQIN